MIVCTVVDQDGRGGLAANIRSDAVIAVIDLPEGSPGARAALRVSGAAEVILIAEERFEIVRQLSMEERVGIAR